MALESLFNDIAAAIHEKDGKADGIVAEDFPARIRALPITPAATASPKDVNFFDYDGTLIYSYTLAEAQVLTALPKGPAHKGLVFQGWNWPLEKIKTFTRPMNVGAMYITDDGKTRLKIRVWDKVRCNVPLYIHQTVSNGITIDWGDGSPIKTLDGSGYVDTTHQYTTVGNYTITLAVSDGCELIFGDNTPSRCVMGYTGDGREGYPNLLQAVNIGIGVQDLGFAAFNNCTSLKKITIPEGVHISDRTFYQCNSLESITIPDGTKEIRDIVFTRCSSLKVVSIPYVDKIMGAFGACVSLSSFIIPDGVTDIGANMLNNCASLSSIVIPDSVTNIGANSFGGCKAMAEYHLKPATPPTLANVNAFSGIRSDCIIYVPAGSLEAYKTAENWSAYADYMQEEQGGTHVNQI